jgi:hypothetical protein
VSDKTSTEAQLKLQRAWFTCYVFAWTVIVFPVLLLSIAYSGGLGSLLRRWATDGGVGSIQGALVLIFSLPLLAAPFRAWAAWRNGRRS